MCVFLFCLVLKPLVDWRMDTHNSTVQEVFSVYVGNVFVKQI